MDCIAHEVAKSQTRLSDFHFHMKRDDRRKKKDVNDKKGRDIHSSNSGLENSMDRGVRQVTVHGITKSQTGLSDVT